MSQLPPDLSGGTRENTNQALAKVLFIKQAKPTIKILAKANYNLIFSPPDKSGGN